MLFYMEDEPHEVFITVQMSFRENVRKVKATVKNACGGVATLFEDGTVECSGNKKFGGDAGDKKRLLVDVEFIKASNGAFAAKKRDGSVVVWGHVDYGGDAKSKQAELIDVQFVVGVEFAFAARRCDGTVVCWGYEVDFPKVERECMKVPIINFCKRFQSHDHIFTVM